MKKSLQYLLFILLICFSRTVQSQVWTDTIVLKKTYFTDDQKQVYLPLGNMSFADAVVAYIPGIPSPEEAYTYPERALGEPDFNFYKDKSYVSLGCRGQLILEFKSNGFVDIEGDDLYFFEIGPSVESFQIDISKDAKDWIPIGKLPGGTSSIDISRSQRVRLEKEVYYYVRITDLGDFCRGPTPGADIDAVGAVGGVLRFNLSGSLLFDTDKYLLKPESKEILDEIANALVQIEKAKVRIDGHTDADSDVAYNLTLGYNRAKSVEKYLKEILSKQDKPIQLEYQTKSYGKAKPISDNLTEEGKQQNRRVEISILPDPSFFKPKQ